VAAHGAQYSPAGEWNGDRGLARVSGSGRRDAALRAAAAAGAVLLAVVTLAQRRQEAALRSALDAKWEATGAAARHPTAASRSVRDPDARAGALGLARALLAEGFHTRRIAELPPVEAAAEARRAVAALDLAATEARAALAARPASWEAALVIGGTRLLAAWRSGDDAVYRDPARWQEPLRHARALAPGAPEPGRVLATGYLSSWHALSDPQRAEARELLRAGFRDPETLAQLLPAWAAVAADEDEIAAVLPPGAQPWQLLQDAYRGQGDWARYCAARERWLPLFARELEERLARGEHRLALGDRAGGAGDLLAVAVAAPPDRRFAPLFARALGQLPAGPVPPDRAEALSRWLRWALPLWQLGKEPLPPHVFGRVASLSAALPPERAALAALAAGDLERAEVWERRSERLWSEEWAPYGTAKAAALLERGHVAEAATALEEVHRSFHGRWAYAQVRDRLAAARGDGVAGGAGGVGAAGRGATEWPPYAWAFDSGQAFLELVPAREAGGVDVAVDVAPERGAAVELAWDGLVLGCFPARQGGVLRLAVPVARAPHQLTARQVAGDHFAPGAVRLQPPAPSP
jgi:hypothetical protein